MSADRHETAEITAHVAAHEPEVEDHRDAVAAVGVLSDAHAPDEHGRLGATDQRGKLFEVGDGQPARLRQRRQLVFRHLGPKRLETFRVVANERFIHSAALNQNLEHAVKERDVAALRDGKPVVTDVRAEERAAQIARHPVTLHAGFEIRVHHDDLGAARLGFVEIFGRDRLVVGRVCAEEDQEVGAKPVGVTARAGGDAERVLHRAGARRMTQARGVVDVVGPEETGDLLRDVIHLVRDAARREVERDALRITRVDAAGDATERVIPSDRRETTFAVSTNKRAGDAPQFAQLGVGLRFERCDVRHERRIERAHRVQAKQIQPRHAEMHAVDRPVVEAGDAERAAIAHALAEDFPCVGRVVAVLPRDLEHVAEVTRLAAGHAKGYGALEFVGRGGFEAAAHVTQQRCRVGPPASNHLLYPLRREAGTGGHWSHFKKSQARTHQMRTKGIPPHPATTWCQVLPFQSSDIVSTEEIANPEMKSTVSPAGGM